MVIRVKFELKMFTQDSDIILFYHLTIIKLDMEPNTIEQNQ